MDIFDQINPPKAASGDIFDRINPQPQGDIFDRINPQASQATAPPTTPDVAGAARTLLAKQGLTPESVKAGGGVAQPVEPLPQTAGEWLGAIAGIDPASAPSIGQLANSIGEGGSSVLPLVNPGTGPSDIGEMALPAGQAAAAQYAANPNAGGTAQANLNKVPVIGQPLAQVAGPAASYFGGNRAPTPQENAAAAEGGISLAGMMLAPKILHAMTPESAAPAQESVQNATPADTAAPPIAAPVASGEAVSTPEAPNTGKAMILQRLQESDPALADRYAKGEASPDEIRASMSKGNGLAPNEVQPEAAAARTTEKPSGAIGEIAKGINPAGASEGAQESADILREAKAKIANAATIERYKYKDTALQFDKAGDRSNIGNISEYERTGQFKNAPEGYSELFQKSMDAVHEGLKQAYGDDKVGYVENYVRRAFKFSSDGDANRATNLLTNWVGSLSANKTPKLGRVFDMPLDEALQSMRANGIKVEPVTTNPEILRQWSLENANQAVTYKGAWDEAKARGLLQYVQQGERPSGNLVPLDDRVAQVFRPTEEGPVKAGQYYAEPGVARIFNNAISKGLGGSPTYQGIRELNNALNSFNLGLSGYHMTFTGINSGLSDLSLGVSHLAHGEFGEAAAPIARSVVPGVSAGRHLMIGRDLINKVIAGDPEAMQTLDKLNESGGRLQMDQTYKMTAYQNMMRAWYNSDYFKAAYNSPLAMVQKVAQPLMEYAIPRIKLGAWMDMANAAVERLGPNASAEDITRARAQAWDNVDDRFGLLVHDNLFWNKTAADLAHVSVRSVGWNTGDIRWIGGALKDIKSGNVLSDRVISAAMLPIYAGTIGAAYQYLHTGTGPQEVKDYFYPKNGLKDKQGNDDRTMPATYMKDIEGYRKAPLATISHKTSPVLSTAIDLATNRDYMGNLIRNPEDPAAQQLEQVGLNLLDRVAPFSITSGVRQYKEAKKAGGNTAQVVQRTAEPFLGFPPAPREMVRSDEQNAAIAAKRQKNPRAPMTPEQVQKLNERQ
jgi:hypothetical protein